MPRMRRLDDTKGEDHTDEREIDWKTVAPRWVLVLALVISVGVNGMLGSMLSNSVGARLEQIQKSNDDPKWDALSKLAYTQGEQGVRLRQHDDMLRDLTSLRDTLPALRGEIQALNLRLTLMRREKER